ncbi:hypothetical protein LSUE1_G000260 [Lachnellula suecica]|uniref:Uncharacterized protein n=1 Tax=Lachnellula suecica TaxID=602035 RepID=A0A8T9CFD0_9HELO|nr:hypothetical protein LSUE1_G000260 [Lachnellula suecica]
MSGTSNVGNSQVYEDGDQKNVPNSQIEQEKKENRFHEGKENSHKANDSKDERSIANKLAREEKRENEDEDESAEVTALKKDPTAPVSSPPPPPSPSDPKIPFGFFWQLSLCRSYSYVLPSKFTSKLTLLFKAKMHGNEPSKGAKIDAQLQAEEEAELKRKGKA